MGLFIYRYLPIKLSFGLCVVCRQYIGPKAAPLANRRTTFASVTCNRRPLRRRPIDAKILHRFLSWTIKETAWRGCHQW